VSNAITVHLPDKQKQSILFEIQLGVPVPADGYPQDSRISMKSMALTNAKGKSVFSFRIPPAEEHIDFTK
jgi:hypothetical protein